MLRKEHDRMINQHSIQLVLRKGLTDTAGEAVARAAEKFLSLSTGKIKSSRIFFLETTLSNSELEALADRSLWDPIVHELTVNEFQIPKGFKTYLCLKRESADRQDRDAFLGSALKLFSKEQGHNHSSSVVCADLYCIENDLSEDELRGLASRLPSQGGEQSLLYGKIDKSGIELEFQKNPAAAQSAEWKIRSIDLNSQSLNEFELEHRYKLSKKELETIKTYYERDQLASERIDLGLPAVPTECEIAVFDSCWSEAQNEKVLDAKILYLDSKNKESRKIQSLNQTYIQAACKTVSEQLRAIGASWYLSLEEGKAAAFKIDDQRLFFWNVAQSYIQKKSNPFRIALDTSVDSLIDAICASRGKGIPLLHSSVMCSSAKTMKMLSLMQSGTEAAANKSLAPTVNGSLVFDNRYSQASLVYKGTGTLLDKRRLDSSVGQFSSKREAHIVCVGKTGTIKALQAVAPVTTLQETLHFVQDVAARGWIQECCNVDKAGFAAAVLGILEEQEGASIDLSKMGPDAIGKAPLQILARKARGLILLKVAREKYDEIASLAQQREVSCSLLGQVTLDGKLNLSYGTSLICHLDLDFLRSEIPKLEIEAEWKKPKLEEPALPRYLDYNKVLLALLNSYNTCSREEIIRQYDHEVQGKTVLKSIMGPENSAPQDAALVRLDFNSFEGIAVSNGILPRYGDLDPYEMAAGAFDEAIRQIIAVGGKLPSDEQQNPGGFWSVYANLHVMHPAAINSQTPESKRQMAMLTQICEATHDMATFFNLPVQVTQQTIHSNAVGKKDKKSIPPTALYSITSHLPDIRLSVTSNFLAEDDLIYQVGATYNELGGSEFYYLFDKIGKNVPKVRKESAKKTYDRISQANELELLSSCHDISDGGLAVALSECCFGAGLGADIELAHEAFGSLSLSAILFSESHSRFVVSIHPDKKAAFELLMGKSAIHLGKVNRRRRLLINESGDRVIMLGLEALLLSWRRELGI